MKTKHNESVRPWVFRLFKQADTPATVQYKTYYGHRYHNDLLYFTDPFSALFSSTERLSLSTSQPECFLSLDATQHEDLSKPLNGQNNYQNIHSIEFSLTVVNAYNETPDTKTFHLADPTGRGFAYLPGQYITLSVIINGQEYKRSYSLASSPYRPHILEITVKRAGNDGIVSNWLNDNLKIGDTIAVKGFFGKFSCLPNCPKKMLLIAAGSGIVPIMSMLRWLADTNASVDVQCLFSFRTPNDIIYGDELQLIATRHPNINIAITLTAHNATDYDWFGLTGRIDEAMIQQIMPNLADSHVYLCGPENFMTTCKQSLLNLKLPPEKLFCESFTVNTPTPNKFDFKPKTSHIKTSGSYQVSFAKSGKTITSNGQFSLLSLAEQSGIHIDNECRSGSCGECMIKCLKGQVEMTEQAEIDAINKQKGWVYSCCAYPVSNVVLEI